MTFHVASGARRLNRRLNRPLALTALSVLLLALAPAELAQARFRRTQPAVPAVAGPLAIWPDKPRGAVILAVSLADQRLTIWDNGVVVARSMVSSGVAGHETPRGVFTVLQKQRMHRSNIYSNAPMPFMQRITWSGVALHQGHVTGRQASHGCVRLPADVAKKLFGYTRMGARVIITDQPVTPTDFAHPKLFAALPWDTPLPAAPAMAPPQAALPLAQAEVVKAAPPAADAPAPEPMAFGESARVIKAAYPPAEALLVEAQPIVVTPVEPDPAPAPKAEAPKPLPQPQGHVSIFISGKERKLFIRQGFEPVYESPVEIEAGVVLGVHLFTAMEANPKDQSTRWSLVSLPVKDPRSLGAAAALERIQISEEARIEVGRRLIAGASLVISDQGLGRETGKTATDFVVLTP